MNRTFIHLLVVAPLFLLASCQDNAARARVQKAEADIEGLRTGMRYLAQQLLTTKPAVLDPTSKGYAFVDTGAGRLLVSWDNAIQYLDGHKVTLRVGNPFNMDFNGFKLTVRFGPRPPVYPASEGVTDSSGSDFASWQSSYATREKALKQQEIPFTESLPSGAWTKIDYGSLTFKARRDRIHRPANGHRPSGTSQAIFLIHEGSHLHFLSRRT